PVCAAEYFARFPARSRRANEYSKEIRKKAQEIARYVLPVATLSYLYHTVSTITLLRYYRLALQYDAPDEQKLVVGRMVEEVLRLDPNYAKLLEEPTPTDATLEEPLSRRAAQPHQPLEAGADSRPPELHVSQEALPHGRLPGPAPPRNPGITARSRARPAARARLHRARDPPSGRSDPREVSRG